MNLVLPKLQSAKLQQICFFFFAQGKQLQSSPIFIKLSYTQFLKFGWFWPVMWLKSPNWMEKQVDCRLHMKWIALQEVLSLKLMKRMYFDTEKALNLSELTENWHIQRKQKGYRRQTNLKVAHCMATHATVLKPAAGNFRVAQFGG